MSKIEELIQDIKDKVIPSEIIKKLDQLKPYVELAELFIEYIDPGDVPMTAVYALSEDDEGRAIELVKQIKGQK